MEGKARSPARSDAYKNIAPGLAVGWNFCGCLITVLNLDTLADKFTRLRCEQ